MAALGCLLPFMLLLAGAAVGGIIGGSNTDAIWGGAIGLAIGIGFAALVLRAFERARNRRPQ